MPRTRIATPRSKYCAQKACAKRRDIAFELTFEEWLKVWKDSGRFERRGRTANEYQMARHGDTGPYAIDNVKIITTSQNQAEIVRENRRKPPPMSEETRKKISKALTGKKATTETRKKLSMMREGVKMNLSPEERLRRSIAITNLNNSSAHRAKQVAGRWPTSRFIDSR